VGPQNVPGRRRHDRRSDPQRRRRREGREGMRCTEQGVERVAQAIYKVDPCFHTHNGVDWEPSDFYSDDLEDHWREIARKQARAALDAMERESLEDVLEPDNVTDVHLMWCRTGD